MQREILSSPALRASYEESIRRRLSDDVYYYCITCFMCGGSCILWILCVILAFDFTNHNMLVYKTQRWLENTKFCISLKRESFIKEIQWSHYTNITMSCNKGMFCALEMETSVHLELNIHWASVLNPLLLEMLLFFQRRNQTSPVGWEKNKIAHIDDMLSMRIPVAQQSRAISVQISYANTFLCL